MRHFYYTSKKNGVDLICDGCGDSIFLKRLGKHSIEGGVFKNEVYEKAPDGWFYRGTTEVRCPKCCEK